MPEDVPQFEGSIPDMPGARILVWVYGSSAAIGGVAIGLMAVLTTADTISRNIGRGSLGAIFDVNLTLLVISAFICLGYAQLIDEHISFTVVFDRLPERPKWYTWLASSVISFAVVSWFLWESIHVTRTSFLGGEARQGMAGLPVWPSRLVIVIGFLLLAAAYIFQVLMLLRYPNRRPLLRALMTRQHLHGL